MRSETHVYLMRGLLGYSRSAWTISPASSTTRASARTSTATKVWQTIADQIVQRRRDGHTGPVVIVGHSLGANATFDVADSLNGRDVPVLLAVIFDATEVRRVPANVARSSTSMRATGSAPGRRRTGLRGRAGQF